jgi:hypothetical protein
MFVKSRGPAGARPWLRALLTFAAASAVLASVRIATADPAAIAVAVAVAG